MSSFLFKYRAAMLMGIAAFRNPRTVNANNFRMLADLLCLILKVQEEKVPYMTHIAFVHPEDGKEHEIASIWVGSGVGAEPTKRIKELIEENRRLKFLLSKNFAQPSPLDSDNKEGGSNE